MTRTQYAAPCTARCAAAISILAGLACSASAAQPPVLMPLLGIDVPPASHERAVVRQAAVTINADALPPVDAAVGGSITMALFPDRDVTGVITAAEPMASGSELYRGTLSGRPGGSFTLVRRGGTLAGDIRLGVAGLIEVRSFPAHIGGAAGGKADAGGAHVVRQVDESLLPPCATGPEHVVVSEPDPDGLRGMGPDDGSVFDVLVMYTAEARDAAGGRVAMEALIDLGVSNTNLSYANSNIPSQVRVVHTGVIDYSESGNASTELGRFRSTSDGVMDGVHCLRDAYAADFCALIVNDFNACGIGYLMSNPSSGFASSAFSVTARGCLSSYTFAHELGHNQGSHHDRDNASSTPAYSYSYGWRTPGEQFRTVMAYAPGSRIPYFSNPDITYQGFVLGVPEGQPNAADNARSIRNTSSIVAMFRQARAFISPIERVSITSSGVHANAASGTDRAAVSDTGGVVVFASAASNLDTADDNGESDIYIHNRASGATACASRAAGGGSPPAAGGVLPSLSGDGQWIAFASDSPAVVSGDSNNLRDVFLRNRVTGTTTRLSVGPGGVQADGPSTAPSLARSGMVVAFESTATNLHFAGGDGQSNIFVRDVGTNTTVRISNGFGGSNPNGPSSRPHLSSDGRFVAFESEADNLVSGDLNGHRDIFLHDRQTQQSVRISVTGSGQEADGPSYNPRVSADGRYIAFESDAQNLVSHDTNVMRDVFLHDRLTGGTRRVSVTTTGGQVTRASSLQDVAADGRLVAFTSVAGGIVPVDTNAHSDLFVRDLATRRTERVSLGWIGQQLNGPVLNGSLSASGRFAVFTATAVNAVPCDGNGVADVLFVDRGEPEVAPCPGDFDADGLVNSGDISAFLTTWLASIDGTTADGDFSGDGTVSSTDISAFLTAWLGSVGGC